MSESGFSTGWEVEGEREEEVKKEAMELLKDYFNDLNHDKISVSINNKLPEDLYNRLKRGEGYKISRIAKMPSGNEIEARYILLVEGHGMSITHHLS